MNIWWWQINFKGVGAQSKLSYDLLRIPIHMLTYLHGMEIPWLVTGCLSLTGARDLCALNALKPRQNGRDFADDIFKWIFLNENVWIPLKISLKFARKVQINTIPALVQIMAWRRRGDKPLSDPMMVSLLTHICVPRPQWVNLTEMPCHQNKHVCVSEKR